MTKIDKRRRTLPITNPAELLKDLYIVFVYYTVLQPFPKKCNV